MEAKTVMMLSCLAVSGLSGCLSSQAETQELNIGVDGTGKVYSSLGGVLCDKYLCSRDLEQDTTITLAPVANDGWEFSHWQGDECDCSNGVVISDVPNMQAEYYGPKTVVIEDFDGDGDVDVASLALFAGQMWIQLNDGRGNFDTPYLGGGELAYPSALDASDWDGDGDIDILVPEYGDETISIFLNDGEGNFVQGDSVVVEGIRPYAIAVHDIDNDGSLDLLIASFEADISGDLKVLEDSIEQAKIAWYKKDEQGEFIEFSKVCSGVGAITLDIGDIDGDEDIDIAASLIAQDKYVWYEQQTDSRYQEHTIASGDGAYGIALGDLDNDEDLDIIMASYWAARLDLSVNQGSGEFSETQAISSFSNGPTATGIADLDGDGYQDINTAVFNNSQIFWLKNLSSSQICTLSIDGEVQITAQFSKIPEADPKPQHKPRTTPELKPQPKPKPNPKPEPKTQSKTESPSTYNKNIKERSGGGSSEWFFLLFLLAMYLNFWRNDNP